jgi:hypothetical protein
VTPGKTKTFIGKTYTLIPSNHISFDSVVDSSSTSSSSNVTAVTALTALGPATSCSYTLESTLEDSSCFELQSRRDSSKQTDSKHLIEDEDDVLPDLELDDDKNDDDGDHVESKFVTQTKASSSSWSEKSHPNIPFTAASSSSRKPHESLLRSPLMLSPNKSLTKNHRSIDTPDTRLSIKDTDSARVFLGCSSLSHNILLFA